MTKTFWTLDDEETWKDPIPINNQIFNEIYTHPKLKECPCYMTNCQTVGTNMDVYPQIQNNLFTNPIHISYELGVI